MKNYFSFTLSNWIGWTEKLAQMKKNAEKELTLDNNDDSLFRISGDSLRRRRVARRQWRLRRGSACRPLRTVRIGHFLRSWPFATALGVQHFVRQWRKASSVFHHLGTKKCKRIPSYQWAFLSTLHEFWCAFDTLSIGNGTIRGLVKVPGRRALEDGCCFGFASVVWFNSCPVNKANAISNYNEWRTIFSFFAAVNCAFVRRSFVKHLAH